MSTGVWREIGSSSSRGCVAKYQEWKETTQLKSWEENWDWDMEEKRKRNWPNPSLPITSQKPLLLNLVMLRWYQEALNINFLPLVVTLSFSISLLLHYLLFMCSYCILEVAWKNYSIRLLRCDGLLIVFGGRFENLSIF